MNRLWETYLLFFIELCVNVDLLTRLKWKLSCKAYNFRVKVRYVQMDFFAFVDYWYII